MLLYADEVSFTVMSARGDALCRLDTFSAFRMDGVTVAQVPLLMRADDPPFGLAMVVVASPHGGPPLAADPPQPGRLPWRPGAGGGPDAAA
jgi:hypothetical protein